MKFDDATGTGMAVATAMPLQLCVYDVCMASSRYIEIDVLRTLAIAGMVLYHTLYDLVVFYKWDINLFSGGWTLFERATATLFLLLVGVSFAISWSKTKNTLPLTLAYHKYLRRGLLILAGGILISTVTYAVEPETFVRFGILHLIGVSILLLPFFIIFKEGNALIGLAVIGLWSTVKHTTASGPLLLPFGVMPPHFQTIDYFPLIPWFGVILLGFSMGYFLYVRHAHPAMRISNSMQWITWPGRHSLIIYLVHQPVVLGVLYLIYRAS
jgi:uncharacterized membrane protein